MRSITSSRRERARPAARFSAPGHSRTGFATAALAARSWRQSPSAEAGTSPRCAPPPHGWPPCSLRLSPWPLLASRGLFDKRSSDSTAGLRQNRANVARGESFQQHVEREKRKRAQGVADSRDALEALEDALRSHAAASGVSFETDFLPLGKQLEVALRARNGQQVAEVLAAFREAIRPFMATRRATVPDTQRGSSASVGIKRANVGAGKRQTQKPESVSAVVARLCDEAREAAQQACAAYLSAPAGIREEQRLEASVAVETFRQARQMVRDAAPSHKLATEPLSPEMRQVVDSTAELKAALERLDNAAFEHGGESMRSALGALVKAYEVWAEAQDDPHGEEELRDVATAVEMGDSEAVMQAIRAMTKAVFGQHMQTRTRTQHRVREARLVAQ